MGQSTILKQLVSERTSESARQVLPEMLAYQQIATLNLLRYYTQESPLVLYYLLLLEINSFTWTFQLPM